MAKNETPILVDSVEALEAKIAEVKAAQEIFATYTQEQVDKIFKAAAIAANKARHLLAKWLLKKQVGNIEQVLLRITMLLSISIMLIKMFRLAGF